MKITTDVPLAPYTTFKIGGNARFFCSAESDEDIRKAVRFARDRKIPIFVLGGGSNILVSDAGFSGLVIKMGMKGVTYVPADGGADADQGTRLASAAAGEDWDAFVGDTVSRGLSGLENLSAIPGSVGAAPVQNIGAYGGEAKKAIHRVRAFDTQADLQAEGNDGPGAFVELSNADCRFSYRDSVFKHQKGRYIITRVDFKLAKEGKPNISYKDVKEYFSTRNIEQPTAQEVRDAVIAIRTAKLPDLSKWGTVGSFFKNPIISAEHFAELRERYPDMPSFPEPDAKVKIPLGWILDRICGAKGLSAGAVGTYEKQSLVLVAKPGATASDVLALAKELAARVKDKTGIDIEREVEMVG